MQAQAATMTIAQAFNLAFERWKDAQEEKKDAQEEKKDQHVTLNGNLPTLQGNSSNSNKIPDSPSNAIQHTCEITEHDEEIDKNDDIHEENLLIDLNSPGDTLDSDIPKIFPLGLDISHKEDMDKRFSR